VRRFVSRREWLTGGLALMSGAVAAGASRPVISAATLSQATVPSRKVHTVSARSMPRSSASH
jgi:hypothetical protein